MTNIQKSILFSLFGFFLFSVGDVLRKVVLVDYSPIQVQVWASLSSVLAILLMSKKLGGWKSLRHITKPHIHIVKALLVTSMMGLSVFSLQRLSLDVYYTLIFTMPMIASILAAIFFKEPLPPAKILLILTGFLGVLLITRPGATIDMVGVVLTLISATFFATNSLLNKLFSPEEPKFPFGFYPYVLAAIVFLAANHGQIPHMEPSYVLMCFFAGACSVFGVVIHVYAFQMAHASVAAPYQYTQLVWGIIFGFILFGNLPDVWVLGGGATIMISGLGLYFYDMKKNFVKTRPTS
ncbi:MAG: DMT family transporter [Rhodospirillales bacterium]|nr:DMT family transporter [Rhodospirillales bacterium]